MRELRQSLTDGEKDLETDAGKVADAYRKLSPYEQNIVATYIACEGNCKLAAEVLQFKYNTMRWYMSTIRKKIKSLL